MQKSNTNLVIVLSCLAVAMLVEAKLPTSYAKRVAPDREALLSLPYHLGPFTGREAHGRDVKGYPGEIHRLYRQAGANAIELIAAPTANNHAPENCLPYMGWSIIERRYRTLEANPGIELQAIVAVSDNPTDHPLACGFYWRRNNRTADNYLSDWLRQRWATVTQSPENAELISICTAADDVHQAGPASERVYKFANDLEPYFHRSSERLVRSVMLQADRP
ncbi:MAG TPA: exosortase-associated EpsI family protein [Terriglobales bacterium]|nr:exosortase-associated EpsI family protein [Terriglobales bacterium]